ncbi:hypothetical protein IC757_00160 [Wenzhouxiangella sp. AB-CW3]|uniref:hypothetical protein n=1 Tax=Wenzhouxiangella sp. AB-CW3 TaxID=2771012 RepID=UPI00168BF445|nr:hypothetical protein [Wenzhouxiangella sp. AB-CW3]QOC22630.1 hypothetical protein IC757_00160 [Wenzhouxiangella sp. AB-CW3]
MQQHLRKPGIGERLGQLAYLLKHTFTIVGRDPGILRPWVRMAIYSMVMTTLFFAGIFSIVIGAYGFGALLLVVAVCMFLYKFFYFVRQELRQSWLVSEALQGRTRSADEAKARVREVRSTARRIALIDMLVAWMLSMARRNGNAGRLVRLFMRGIEEVWDLVNHYLLPTTAVDGCNVREGIGRMKALRDNVPETLTGVFGIDIAARAVGTIMAPVYALLVLLAIGLGLWVGDSIAAFYVGDLREMLGDVEVDFLPEVMHFSWLPLLVVLWMGKLGSVVLERVTTSVKVIYYSIFYMRITHIEEIIPEIRDDLDSYLRMEAEEVTPVAGQDAPQPDSAG